MPAPERASDRGALRDRVRRRLFDGAPEHPERIGRFEIRGRLGAGGMSVVLEGFDSELERPVAIKLLSSSADRGRLQREAKAMARLDHPNIAGIYDVGEHEGDVYVAMEYVSGQTLGQWIRGRDGASILRAFIQAGRGLHAAHEAGVVHRDFKPDNVMVGEAEPGEVGRVRVLDFGLAKALEGAETTPEQPTDATEVLPEPLALTRTGALVGTPRYMSPEQFEAGEVGPASDQFSFCVALYEALVGRPPFAGKSLPELGHAVSTAEPEPPAPETIPGPLWAVIRRGLAKAPTDRHASMRELVQALEQHVHTAAPRSGRRRALLVVLAVTVAGGLAIERMLDEPTRHVPAQERHGSLPAADVQAVARQHHRHMHACQVAAMKRVPMLHGKVKLELAVGADGVVTEAVAAETALFDAMGRSVAEQALVDCLLAEAQTWRFPAPKGGPVRIAYPYVLASGPEAVLPP